MRVSSLKNSTLGEALFRPFNEHMAPLFETVSYLAWVSAGRHVQAVPTTFQFASFLAFGSTLGMLAALVRLETRSSSAVLMAVAVFSLSSVSAETILWYSACSFQWAAAATLAAWFAAASFAGATSRKGRIGWMIAAVLASTAAPAFSAIGILATPLAVLRLMIGQGEERLTLRRICWASVPLLGLAAYLIVCAAFRYRQVLAESLSKNLEPGAAVWATLRAPSLVLIPGLVGLRNQAWAIPGWVAAGSTIAILCGALVVAVRSRRKSLILGGVGLILGGYLLAYAARAHQGDLWIFEISRYHLFPQLGLVCVMVGVAEPMFRSFDRSRVVAMASSVSFAAVLATLQGPGMNAATGNFRFPNQPGLISASVRLEEIARREGITIDQLFRILDPIQPRWAPHPWPFHPVLFLLDHGPAVAKLGDPAARAAIVAGLSDEEREAIFGGMEATRYRVPAHRSPEGLPPTIARLVATRHVARLGDGSYSTPGGLAYLEYSLDPSADEARAFSLPMGPGEDGIELWWADHAEPWSDERSVRWKPDPECIDRAWEVPIDAFPHWRKGSVRRIRIVTSDRGRLTVEAPRFVR